MRSGFQSITSEGGLIPPDLLRRISRLDRSVPGLAPADYLLPEHERLTEAINRAWARLVVAWRTFQSGRDRLGEEGAAIGATRDRWLLPLFAELGYGRLPKAAAREIEGRTYPISHQYNQSPIHLLGAGVSLDTAQKGVPGAARASPHGMVQDYLNRSPARWGYVSNGLLLRVLRDHHSLTQQAFVEFDLEAMMEGELYSEFAVLWMVCHQSRVYAERPDDFWLERWFRLARDEGVSALERLRGGVRAAIEALGGGFLRHRGSAALQEALEKRTLSREDFYRQLLRLVYRLIFLMVAEEREVLLDPEATSAARRAYEEWYALRGIRELADRRRGGAHEDLWRRLQVVMKALWEGDQRLALPALGSFLWSPRAIPALDGAVIANEDLLGAFRELCWVSEGKQRYPVSWRTVGADELGSVYEGLLELRPRVDRVAGEVKLDVAAGHERKTTGSYYTPTSLVDCLLDSALAPVLEEAAKRADPEKAILALRVVDPACGSGHFLVAAARRMAKKLASIRSGDDEPSPPQLRRAIRDVVGHCLHGVDLNEMAVELCKVSLWMEAIEPGRPLSFLESKIRVGNALIGATPALIAKGLPDEAFVALEGDNKKAVAELRRKNRNQRDGQIGLFSAGLMATPAAVRQGAEGIEAIPDDSIEQIHQKEKQQEALEQSEVYRRARLVADAWCAAFVARKATPEGITTDTLRWLGTEGRGPTPAGLESERLARRFGFFHWHLEFPEVCRAPQQAGEGAGTHGWVGGFDLVIGNPPWERVKLQEKEWFSSRRRPDIADAGNAAQRKKMIEGLAQTDPALYEDFLEARRQAEAESHFLRASGRYPLCGQGDVNTYTVFAEWNRVILKPRGRVGCIVPTGIATDDTTKEFFQDLIESRALVSLLSFENEEFLFPAVHHAVKFSLLVATTQGRGALAPQFVFFARQVDEARDPARTFTLSADELRQVNPNTRTCPTFRSSRDAEIAKKIYARVPVLVREGPPEVNPWSVTFVRLFDMANDSHLFRERIALESDGWKLQGNIFTKGEERYLPLYEAKMVHHFDHRYGTYEGQTEAQSNQGILPRLTQEQRNDPSHVALPWFWVPEEAVKDSLKDRWSRPWLMGWRDICRSTDERTVIAAILPRTSVGHQFPLILTKQDPNIAGVLCSVLSSLVYDYCARQKVGGTHLTIFVMEQLPLPAPTVWLKALPWLAKSSASEWCRDRVLEMTFTANDLCGWAKDLGYTGRPFRWDADRRARIRAELDAAMFHLYGLDRSDTEHILETFPVLKKNEESYLGEFRTKRLVLESYDAMARARADGTTFQTTLDPPPGDPRAAHTSEEG